MLEFAMAHELDDALVKALQRLCDTEGGYKNVAAIAKCHPHSIYEILRGYRLPSGRPKGIGRQLREKLDRAFPGWIDITVSGDWTDAQHASGGTGSRGATRSLAQQVSDPAPSMAAQEVAWESLLSAPLPARFRLTLLDDAMALDDPPSMRRGDWAEFTPATTAQPNQVVLLADRDGNVYVRRYTLRRPGHWIATARHGGFADLDSLADGLRVLAVQVASGWA